jgi:F-type H+-transporting ATPase subunit gamma
MSGTSSALQHKLNSATDLKSVVRTMKSMAGANIAQYENAVHSLDDYYRTVQLGLLAYFQQNKDGVTHTPDKSPTIKHGKIGIIVIGSDQGLVGQFNDALITFLNSKLVCMNGTKLFWPVGERIQVHIDDLALPVARPFMLPSSIDAITTLVTDILQEIHSQQQNNQLQEVYLFFNRTLAQSQYEPSYQRILPLDNIWQQDFLSESWPTACRPQLLTEHKQTFSALIGEYLFTSLFRACIESLASENASRLIAMQRAEKNIEEIQTQLLRQYHRQRQSAIDEELADLVGGFEALSQRPDGN